jgi:23S rRNA (adenine2030-N6)-methyltransferase
MPYEHFGKIGDIWKHLPLCDVINIENPKVYIETNSAYPEYSLYKSDEQKYGIYTFIDKAVDFPLLKKSKYFELISPYVRQDKYLGSPALAISLLKESAEELIYFDLDKEACNSIKSYSIANNITANINVFNLDSIVGVIDILPDLPKSTLIHIDPYIIDQPASNGMTYIDLFIKASEQGLKCFLWYGFLTLDDKNHINDYINQKLTQSEFSSAYCYELIMKIIQKDSVLCNPGVLGCGILTGNLSSDSNSIISEYADLLVDLYKGTTYLGFEGDLYKETRKI